MHLSMIWLQKERALYDHLILSLSTHSFPGLLLYLVYKIIFPVTDNLMYELDQGDNSE